MASAIRILILVAWALVLAALPAAAQGQPAAQPLPPGTNPQVEALLQGAFKLEWGNKPEEADARYRDAVALAEKISDPKEKGELPRALTWQTQYFLHMKKYGEAWTTGERALKLHEERLGPDVPRTISVRGVLGAIGTASGEYGRAEPYLEAVVAAYERKPDKELAKAAAVAAANLAAALAGQEKLVEAEDAIRKSIVLLEKQSPRDDARIAMSYRYLAIICMRERKFSEAAFTLETGVMAAENLKGPRATTLVVLLVTQADFLRGQKKFDEAIHSAERALVLREILLGKDHVETARAHALIAKIAAEKGDIARSDAENNLILWSYSRTRSKEAAPEATVAAFNLAKSARLAKKPADAEKMIKGAIVVREAVLPDDSKSLALFYQVLALSYLDQRKFDAAETEFRKAAELYTKGGKPEGIEVANLFLWLGNSLFEAGRYQAAEQPLRTAVEILSKLDDPMPLTGAQVSLSVTYRYLRRFRESEELVRKALTTRQQKLGLDDPLVADAQFNLAAVLRWEGRYSLAEPLFRRSMIVREKVYGPDHALVLADKNSLALTLDSMGRSAEAEELLRTVLMGREKTFGADSSEVADTLVSLAMSLYRQDRLADAAALAERPLAIYRKVLGPDHPFVVRGLLTLAMVRQGQSEFEEADRLYHEALRIRTAVYGAQDTNVADSYGDLVRLSIARRQYEEAAGYMSKRLAIYESRVGQDDPRLIRVLVDLQSLQSFNKDFDAAEATAKRILAMAEHSFGTESLQAAFAANSVAEVYRLRGKFGDFARYYEHPLDTYRKILGPRHPVVAYALSLIAQFRTSVGDTKEALALHDESIAIVTAAYGADSPVLCSYLNGKALLLLQVGRASEAVDLLQRTIELQRRGAGKPTVILAVALVNLSAVYDAVGFGGEAIKLRREAVEIYTKLFGPDRIPPLVPAPIVPPGHIDET